MATDICLTPRILQEIIIAVLECEIGTYRYNDGTFTTSAVSIGNPPNDVTVEGLEVILPIFPDTKVQQTGVLTHQCQVWDIVLIERVGGSGKIFQAIPKLLDLFYCAQGYYHRQEDTVGSYEYYRLEFKIESLTERLNLSGLQRLINASEEVNSYI